MQLFTLHRCGGAPRRMGPSFLVTLKIIRIQNEDTKVNDVANAVFCHLNTFKCNESWFFKLN